MNTVLIIYVICFFFFTPLEYVEKHPGDMWIGFFGILILTELVERGYL